MTKPGPANLLTDVDGLTVGNAQDQTARTGVTVILPERPANAGVDVRGGGPGTRETDALDPACLVDAIHGIVLSGGSVYGLDAASGVVSWLGARGRGFQMPGAALVAPVVPAAILFDLTNGGTKDWGEEPPYNRLGRDAAAAAAKTFALGNAGAGLGARAGAYKGGLGSASAVTPDGVQIGALAAVNSAGSPVIPGTGTFWAWAFEQNGELGRQHAPQPARDMVLDVPTDIKGGTPGARQNTTIGVVATNADLTPAEARRLAIMAQDGYARALRPIHTPFDGDVLFALATGRAPLPDPRPVSLSRLGLIAADCMARAVARGVYEAEDLGEWTSYRSAHGGAFG